MPCGRLFFSSARMSFCIPQLFSDTGYCADHPEQAYRANVELPVWLARAAAETDAKLVAFSSDQVYAGVEQSGPLPETIPLQPANVYGQGKLEMEQQVQALCPSAVVAARHMDGTTCRGTSCPRATCC